jgi:hypothetical protein
MSVIFIPAVGSIARHFIYPPPEGRASSIRMSSVCVSLAGAPDKNAPMETNLIDRIHEGHSW